MLIRMALWSIKASYVIGGLAGIAAIIAVISGIVKPHSHGWDGVLTGTPGNGLSAAWQWAVVCVAAYVILYRLIPAVLLRGAARATDRAETQGDRLASD